ncbi:thiamine pyrophosphate-dependent dehydrogenase E1 component subunit alpha [Patescibacteria group bacterium]
MVKMSKLNLEFYKKLYLIRKAEKEIQKYYHEDEMKTPMHMSMGEEGIVVGICQALGKNSQVFGTYRSHALYLAKTMETDKFFAEMYGKLTGGAKGKAGSMHLSFPESGFMGASAIVASNIPVAVGAAFANRQKKTGKITAVFFGDGALDEGNFWESLNVACLMKIPILFVCEDNGLAIHSFSHKRQGYNSITEVISKFNCNVFQDDTTDTEKIYKLGLKAIKSIKKTKKPAFIHLKYYRYLEHVGVNEDFDAGYRSKKDFEKWYKKDPMIIQRKKILNLGVKPEKIEKEIDHKIKNSINKAKKAPFAKISETYEDVFCKK